MVVTCHNKVDVNFIKDGDKSVSENDGVGLVDVLTCGIESTVHENELPFSIGILHIVDKPVLLSL